MYREYIVDKVASTLVKAGSSFHCDQVAAYERAIEAEDNERAKWVLRNILDNAAAGDCGKLPLCDDTGIPHLFLEVGNDAVLPAGFMPAVKEGVRLGLRQLPGRPMAVRGEGIERIDQALGMYDDPGMLEPAPIQIRSISGSIIRLTILMYGGGPEIRGKTLRVFHKHSLNTVKQEMISWGLEGAKLLGCLPAVLAFGIGRSNVEAASLSLEAMAKGNFLEQSDMETEITSAINDSGVGPLGVGGRTTVLGTFVRIGPQRASGVRIVSLRVGCCFDPRRATWEWDGKSLD